MILIVVIYNSNYLIEREIPGNPETRPGDRPGTGDSLSLLLTTGLCCCVEIVEFF